jgi:hypothetical protein
MGRKVTHQLAPLKFPEAATGSTTSLDKSKLIVDIN